MGSTSLSKPDCRLLRIAVRVLIVVAFVGAPLYFSPYVVLQLAYAAALAVAVVGLTILTGYGGQISLGHAFFFAIGGYTTAILVSRWDVPQIVAVAAAGFLAFALGIVFGVPALRLKGIYLGVVSLALAVVTVPLIKRFEGLTGGATGLSMEGGVGMSIPGLAADQTLYYWVLVVSAVMFVGAHVLLSSHVGRVLIATRDNEIAARSMGIGTSGYHVRVFGLSGLYGGVGGGLYVIASGFIAPESVTLLLSIMLVAALVVGGKTSLFGAVLGALFIQFVPRVTSAVDAGLSALVLGALLIVVLRLAPDGLAGVVQQAGRVLTRLRRDDDTTSGRPSRSLSNPR